MSRPHQFSPPWINVFERPCPWFEKQISSFPQFPRLPKELQLLIWELAIATISPRCISIRTVQQDGEGSELIENMPTSSSSSATVTAAGAVRNRRLVVTRVRSTAPTLLFVNVDSRKLTLGRYQQVFLEQFSRQGIFFDVETDVLEFKDFRAFERFSRLAEQLNDFNETSKITKLIMWLPFSLHNQIIQRCCTTFHNLQNLKFVEPNRNIAAARWPPARGNFNFISGLPHTVVSCEFAKYYQRSDLVNLISAKIQSQKEARGEVAEAWIPPDISWGTRSQYSNLELSNANPAPPFETMEWQSHTHFPSLDWNPAQTNDYASLAQAARRNKRLLDKVSWYERHGFARRGLLWR